MAQGHVLVVDDDPIGRLALETLFSSDGYRVTCADGGLDALACARANPPHIVILDILMPDLDGFSVCRELRRDPSTRTAIIYLVTSLDDPETQSRGEAAGADRILTKPFNFPALREEILARLGS